MQLRHLPNGLTVLRILFSPVLFVMILLWHSAGGYLLSYYLFVAAGLTDIYDGHLARQHENITTFGKLVDPVADKVLLAATLIPFYMLSGSTEVCRHVTLTVVLILLGRELLITALRYYSMWTGTAVISASRLAKFKTASQMLFIGSILVRFFHRRLMVEHPEFAYGWFDTFHDRFNFVLILAVVALSVISAIDYLVKNLPTILRQSHA